MELESEYWKTLQRELPYIVGISDLIRWRVIDCLLNSQISLRESYGIIHQIHFLNEQEALKFWSTPHKRNHDTSLPVREHDSMSILPLSSLHAILPALFASIEDPKYSWDFADYISILDMLLRLCHIPHDGAWRTNEDFLVLFGRRNSLNLTFSSDGQRWDWDKNSLVHERMVAHKMLLEELKEFDTLQSDEIDWFTLQIEPQDPPEIVLKKRWSPWFILYQRQKHQAGIILLEALRNPNVWIKDVQKKFPRSYQKTKETILRACSQEYKYLSI